MPPLLRPDTPHSVTLPVRHAKVAARPDVLVVGGGPAGIGAALGAARAGADTVLVERYGFLGGNATVALVMPWMSFHTQRPQTPRLGDVGLMPTDHGEGEPVVGGFHVELIERLVAAGGAIPPSDETGYTVPFDPEVFKSVALHALDDAGVHYLLHAFCSGVTEEHERSGVVLETKSGPLVVQPRAVVDGTGDGDVAAAAGAEYAIGRKQDGLTQPMTLMFRMADFEREEFARYVKEHPGEWRGVHGLWELVKEAAAAGDLELPREDILFFGTPHEREVAVNSSRITGVLGIDAWDLSRAEMIGRYQVEQISTFLRDYVPGFSRSYMVQSGVSVGVRETRRVLGQYVLTAEDILTARKFDDVIARGTYPIDIHNPAGKGTVLRSVPPGDAYDIPLRCLLPRRVDGILTSGRCISGTHEAHSSYRVTPTAMATGQAAGVCAALAAARHRWPREIPARDVQAELLRQGADLGMGAEGRHVAAGGRSPAGS
jgi:ribulose 1,5-bisphosphate synthetase/thiazole synthase